MDTLLAPGPWHVTGDDHVVRDVNGSPIAIILARHPAVHAAVIADLPNRRKHADGAKDVLIGKLREQIAEHEETQREADGLAVELADLREELSAVYAIVSELQAKIEGQNL